MKKKLTVVLAIILVLFNTACSNTSLNPIEQKESVEQEISGPPKSGGKINLAATSTLNLDPLKANDDETKAVLSLIYEGLVKIDGQGMVQPALAESWEIDDAGRTYTIKLRTDVRWHNGETFSSADVKATFDKITELKKLRLKDYEPGFPEFNNIQSYEISDEYTFTISLFKPDADFLYEMNRGILSMSFIEASRASNATEQTISEFIGTGPFKVVSKTSDSVSLKRNDEYFGEKPYIEEINIKIYPDNTSVKEAFNNRDVDIITIESEDWNIFQ